jgi:hypothetical protein
VTYLKVNEEYNEVATIDFFFNAEGAGEDLPPGVEEVTFLGFAPPGASGVGYPGGPIEPGDYVFMCIVPDEEGTPHAASGMVAEFTVPE